METLSIVRNQRALGFRVMLDWETYDAAHGFITALFEKYGVRTWRDSGDVVIERFGYSDEDGYTWLIALCAERPDALAPDALAFVERFNAAVGARVLDNGSGRPERCVEFTCQALPAIRKALNEGLLRRWASSGALVSALRLGYAPSGKPDYLWRVCLKDEAADECLRQLAITVSEIAEQAAGGAPPAHEADPDLDVWRALSESWEAFERGEVAAEISP